MPIRAVIFDLMDVLILTGDSARAAPCQTAARLV